MISGHHVPGYRPSERLAFAASTKAVGGTTTIVGDHARIDVLPSGDVVFMSGTTASSDWTSLDGIYFVASDATYTWTAPTFANGWANYTAEPSLSFSPLRATRDTVGRVHVKGVVRQGTFTEGTTIATLPTNQQPANYLTFSTTSSNAYNSTGARTTYGLRARGISSPWLSIQTMFYPGTVGSWTNLSLTNGWVTYDTTYATPAYTKAADGVVTLRGRIKSGTTTNGTTIATLPAGFRPGRSISFSVPAYDDRYGRIDITASGTVMIRTASASWTSLDGISFIAE